MFPVTAVSSVTGTAGSVRFGSTPDDLRTETPDAS